MKIVEEYSKHFIQLKQDINMASTNGRRCTEALKVEPINQPFMLDWSRGWAAVPKTVVDGFESCIEHKKMRGSFNRKDFRIRI